ncbi:tail tube [Pseudomonas sp. StFLB209]|uniref:phage protein n=1 Tax=Pseudomonas sp. StFLB209 TaxID=1028989 RepID=UPI0004F67633|nr:phage protein [Pseudomonas sp. StFLB209]BAP41300.1 tail tube [Pseudomonas sp. StFLB209]
MTARIGGMNFDVNVGDSLMHVDAASLDITDNSGVAKNKGVPNGRVKGDVAAAGELELDSNNFDLLVEQARSAGSFRALEPFDIVFFAKAGTKELRIEAFGCLVRISSLLSLDPNGGSKTTHKIPFDVTSPDFIKINGVPYLDSTEIEGLT